MLCKDKVIILKQTKFSEADLIVRTLTQKGALISFIAKGALKSKKRFMGGVLEPGHYIGVEYKLSRRSLLHFLNQAWFLRRFDQIRTDYDRLNLALYFLSVIDKVSQEGMDSPDLFDLLGNSLEAAGHSPNLFILQFVFEFRLLWCQGVLPKEFQHETTLLNTTTGEHHKLHSLTPQLKQTAEAVHLALEHYTHGPKLAKPHKTL